MMALPMLAIPSFNLPFEVEIDALGFGVRAVLIQSKCPIAFYNHTLAVRDRVRSIYERELMAVVMAGLENKAADALSRKPPDIQLCGISAPVLVDPKTIKEKAEKDEKFKKLISKLSSGIGLQNTVGGHSEFLRTYKRIASELFWEGMKSDVKKHCEECLICQRNKVLALSPTGLLTPLEVPQQIWSDISMDFVEGLPKAKGFEVVLVVVDRLSKYSHFLPLKHLYTAKVVADLFVKKVVQLHGFPTSIVSDKDKVFLSHFWKELFRLADKKLHRSTSYHPQSYGLTEAVNRGLETYLQCFCNERPKLWVEWLSWVEYWYNTTFQRALRVSPFQVVYGQKPHSLLSYRDCGMTNAMVDE
ncbi:transposon Tf2-1 polyprotein isoform X1 [Cucumis melo var. makuwa]|uniref:Transposon Tf2-1 polyprotein isoform X1 n=1 Tax=Cucumis melo var. makuwa TaxID=1194695 RepID=A0A5A7T9I6_CUCMM|nr:transposon Tf2-1 polyprotein isoform X1 [Cucumis melo var. makuwa]